MFVGHLETIYNSSNISNKENIEEKMQFLYSVFAVTSKYYLPDRIVRSFGGLAGFDSLKSDSTQGGLGEIGVENWVLQNGGSFVEVAISFTQNALLSRLNSLLRNIKFGILAKIMNQEQAMGFLIRMMNLFKIICQNKDIKEWPEDYEI